MYVLLLLENTSLATPFIFWWTTKAGQSLEKFLLATPARGICMVALL
jgi:hypothetical protein